MTVTRNIVVTGDCDGQAFEPLSSAILGIHELIYGETKTLTITKKLVDNTWSTVCGATTVEVLHVTPSATSFTSITMGTDND